MKRLKLICLIAAGLDFVCGLKFSIKPETGLQFLFMLLNLLLALLIVISLVMGAGYVGAYKFRAFIPAMICLAGLPASLFVATYLGVSIRDWKFRENLPRYREVIQLIQKGELRANSSPSRIQLPDKFADLAVITIVKTNSHSMIIEFVTGLGFPVKHSGYLYVSDGKIEGDPGTLERWPYREMMDTNWFRVSD